MLLAGASFEKKQQKNENSRCSKYKIIVISTPSRDEAKKQKRESECGQRLNIVFLSFY